MGISGNLFNSIFVCLSSLNVLFLFPVSYHKVPLGVGAPPLLQYPRVGPRPPCSPPMVERLTKEQEKNMQKNKQSYKEKNK